MPYTVSQNQATLEIGRSPTSKPSTRNMITIEELKELKMKRKMSKKLHKSPKSGPVLPQPGPENSNNVPQENNFADHHIHPSQYFPYIYKVPRQYRHLLVSPDDMPQQFQIDEPSQSQAQAVYQSQKQKQQHKQKHVRFGDSPAVAHKQALPAQIDDTVAGSSTYLAQQELVMQQNQHQQFDYNSSPPPSYNEVANGKSQDGSMPEEDAQTMIKAVVMICCLVFLYQIVKFVTMMEDQLLVYVIYVGLIGYILTNYLSRSWLRD